MKKYLIALALAGLAGTSYAAPNVNYPLQPPLNASTGTVTNFTCTTCTINAIHWADGTVQVSSPPAASGGGGGGPLQVKISSTTTGFNWPFDVSDTVYHASPSSATIALTSASHAVKVTVSSSLTCTDCTQDAVFVTVYRDGVNLMVDGASFLNLIGYSGTGSAEIPVAFTIFDKPGDTSPHTYNIRIRSNTGTTNIILGDGNIMTILALEEVAAPS